MMTKTRKHMGKAYCCQLIQITMVFSQQISHCVSKLQSMQGKFLDSKFNSNQISILILIS